MLDPPNGNAFSAAANGFSKRIQRSNQKKSEPQDLEPVPQGLKTAQNSGMRTVCIRFPSESVNTLTNDNKVRPVYPVIETESSGDGISADDTGYSTCVSGMPRSFVSSPAVQPRRSGLQ